MRIAIDAFGGDNAPDEVIKGAVDAHREYGVEIILAGDKEKIAERFEALKLPKEGIAVENANGIIRIEDNPMDIRNSKADSSMGTAFRLLTEGKADAFVSGGSTAAIVAGGTLLVGRIKGVKRPALAPVMPSLENYYMLLDGGANIECRPEMLRQFAVMGSVYMEKIMRVSKPRVALMNVGTEDEKGRSLEHETLELLRNSPINFIGNAEGRDVVLGVCDVIVTDGFTGNVFLKTVEGMGSFMKTSLKGLFNRSITSKIGAVFTMKGIKELSRKMDYKEVGGSPLLGVKKPVIKAHGSSDAKAFKNAVRQAKEFIDNNVIQEIERNLNALN